MPWCKFWNENLESWNECEECTRLTQETAHIAGTKDEICLIRFCDSYKMGNIRPVETYDKYRHEWMV